MEERDKVVIAFDVDGTLCLPAGRTAKPEANEAIRTLMFMLSCLENTRIVVWSGAGELYARQVCNELHVSHFVDGYAAKGTIAADITIDDETCTLGQLNLKL
jgi:phosphoserine phosphatase